MTNKSGRTRQRTKAHVNSSLRIGHVKIRDHEER